MLLAQCVEFLDEEAGSQYTDVGRYFLPGEHLPAFTKGNVFSEAFSKVLDDLVGFKLCCCL